MSGVHIHKIGQFDWLEQQKDPILTVPGSYWLCHKNNIYKFTFKYHRTVRNAKAFAYGKELMKVVRRIIKCQPRQGQQFCTKHILATYNHISWTRQDRMFAMLKFREHTEAATVTRAIVLTVKVFKNEHSMPDNMVFQIKTEQETIESLMHNTKDCSNKNIENDNEVDIESSNDTEFKINSGNSDKHINNLNISYNPHNLNSETTINDSDATDKCKISKYNSQSSISRFANTQKKNTHKTEDCLVSFEEEKTEKNESYNNIEKSSFLNQFEFNQIAEQEENKAHQVNSNLAADINGANDEVVLDSANLPYQYLIEKEIENAKKKVVRIPFLGVNKSIPVDVKSEFSVNSTTKSETKNIKKIIKENNKCDKNCTKQNIYIMQQNTQEKHTKNIKCTEIGSQEWEDTYSKTIKADHSKYKSTGELNRKNISEESTLKSSNITDLIMKGCMFTIQQDKDSVSVLEQKTKSDVDEVLENSEKVETKEGEKCLLNSSLLKLENLVTMIEAPKENITHNYKSKIVIGNNIPLQSTLITKDYITNQYITKPTSVMALPRPSFHSHNIPTLNKLFDKSIIQNEQHELNIKETTTHNTATKCIANVIENDETEEKSIISKIQHWNNGSKNPMVKQSNSCEVFYLKDHITTNMEFVLTPDNTHSTESNTRSLQTNSLLHLNETVLEDCINNSNSKLAEITANTTSNHIFNTPRIISNQVITIDQMPLGLQNIVKKKLSKTNVSRNIADELNLQNAELSSRQLKLSSKSANLEEKSLETESESNIVANYTNALPICSNFKVIKETTVSCGKRKRSHHYDAKNNAQREIDEMIPSIQEKIHSPIDKIERHKRRTKQDCEYNTKKKVKMPAHISDIVKQKYSKIPNKLQDITEEFYQDLMQHRTHNKTVDCKGHRQTRASLYLDTDGEDENVRIEMLKFIEDITRGVKVVLKRMSRKSISSILGKSSSLAYIN